MAFQRVYIIFFHDIAGLLIASLNFSFERGILSLFFQGWPVSPFLFLFAIDILAIAIRSNDKIKGLKVGDNDKKINLLTEDTICFL